MKEHQAREIIFETKIKRMLQESGYISVINEKVYGRSGDHGIFSYAQVNIPMAFVFPVRLLCQYKYYAKNKVELSHIRDFGGIMADVSECNYAMKNDVSKKSGVNISDRYTDAGCYFSVTAFSRAAQEYAWAHNIFMVSLEKIEILQPMLKNIEEFVGNLSENTITNITRDELILGYENYCVNQGFADDNIQAVVAILNGVYPVLMFGANEWLSSVIFESEMSESGRVVVEQTGRSQNQFETKFDVMLKEVNVEFSVPNVIIEKMMERKDNHTRKGVIFEVEVPYVKKKGKKGFASMEMFIDGFSKDEYGFEQISFF